MSALPWYPTLDVAPRAGLAGDGNLPCLRAIALITFLYRGITNRITFPGDDAARRFPTHNVDRDHACLLVALEHAPSEHAVLRAEWETSGDEKADNHGALGASSV